MKPNELTEKEIKKLQKKFPKIKKRIPKKRLNKDINIDLLFITHAHVDHIKGLKSVYKEFKPTVFTRNEEVIEKNICDITYFDKPYILDDLEVSYFNLSHDSDCIGIKIKENNKD